jgi:hypothetical protein
VIMRQYRPIRIGNRDGTTPVTASLETLTRDLQWHRAPRQY